MSRSTRKALEAIEEDEAEAAVNEDKLEGIYADRTLGIGGGMSSSFTSRLPLTVNELLDQLLSGIVTVEVVKEPEVPPA